MTFKYLFPTIYAAATLFFAAACSSNDDPNAGLGDSYLTVVTLEQNGTSGSIMSFTPANDDPLITLSSETQFDSRLFKVNSRIYVQYVPLSGDPLKSGPVKIIGATNVEGGGAKPAPAPTAVLDNYTTDDVTVTTLMRAGRYINMSFIASTQGDPKQCVLYIDENSLSERVPCLYFVFEGTPGINAMSYTFIGSWDIGDIWNLPDIDGIRLFYGNDIMKSELLTKDPAITGGSNANTPAE